MDADERFTRWMKEAFPELREVHIRGFIGSGHTETLKFYVNLASETQEPLNGDFFVKHALVPNADKWPDSEVTFVEKHGPSFEPYIPEIVATSEIRDGAKAVIYKLGLNQIRPPWTLKDIIDQYVRLRKEQSDYPNEAASKANEMQELLTTIREIGKCLSKKLLDINTVYHKRIETIDSHIRFLLGRRKDDIDTTILNNFGRDLRQTKNAALFAVYGIEGAKDSFGFLPNPLHYMYEDAWAQTHLMKYTLPVGITHLDIHCDNIIVAENSGVDDQDDPLNGGSASNVIFKLLDYAESTDEGGIFFDHVYWMVSIAMLCLPLDEPRLWASFFNAIMPRHEESFRRAPNFLEGKIAIAELPVKVQRCLELLEPIREQIKEFIKNQPEPFREGCKLAFWSAVVAVGLNWARKKKIVCEHPRKFQILMFVFSAYGFSQIFTFLHLTREIQDHQSSGGQENPMNIPWDLAPNPLPTPQRPRNAIRRTNGAGVANSSTGVTKSRARQSSPQKAKNRARQRPTMALTSDQSHARYCSVAKTTMLADLLKQNLPQLLYIVGLPGTGKTSFVNSHRAEIDQNFVQTFRFDMKDGYTLQSILDVICKHFKKPYRGNPDNITDYLHYAAKPLHEHPCLIILDSLQDVIEANKPCILDPTTQLHLLFELFTNNRQGYPLMSKLLALTWENPHIISSNGMPIPKAMLIEDQPCTNAVGYIVLDGIKADDPATISGEPRLLKTIFEDLQTSLEERLALINLVDGNPQYIKALSFQIQQKFGGNPALFLQSINEHDSINLEIDHLFTPVFRRLTGEEKILMDVLFNSKEGSGIDAVEIKTAHSNAFDTLRRRCLLTVKPQGERVCISLTPFVRRQWGNYRQ